MRATVIHGTRDIRFDEVPDPVLGTGGDAIVRVVAACVCGSDLWPYRGAVPTDGPHRIGHEFVGVVEAVGDDVERITVVVVGDGAVGLCAVLASRRLGASRIVAMSRHADRQALAREFGATDIVEERGDEGVARIRELFDSIGADCVLECVGTKESMDQAIRSARPGGMVGYVGSPNGGSELPVRPLFGRNVGVNGGVAPVRNYIEELLPEVWSGDLNPGRVFDLELPMADVASAYAAMDERRATKVLLRP